VNQALAAVHMESLAARKPHELSGGQQQRVALARCLTQKPRIVLMDEPLANLDMHLRESMLNEFRRFHRNSGATIIYITHDQAEAMSIADRIAVMFNGALVQIATPEELYEKPADAQVAGFVGLSSLLPGTVSAPGQVALNGNGTLVQAVMANGSKPGDEVLLCVRPEEVALGDGPFQGRVQRIMYLGGRYMVELESGQTMIKAYANARYGQGDTVSYAFMRTWAMPQGG
jgi:iron(III) transport system ATP-binding protein